VEREAVPGYAFGRGAEAIPAPIMEAIMEQSWPRRAPRVVLGYEVLRRWCRPLGRAAVRPPAISAVPAVSDGGLGGQAGG
jgi:hypothetical protein